MTGSADGRIRRYDLRVGKLYSDLVGSRYLSFSWGHVLWNHIFPSLA